MMETREDAFDVCTWIGAWPFAPAPDASLAEITRSLQAVGVSGALVSPLRALLAPEPMSANLALFGELADRDGDDFTVRLAPIVDPSLPNWRDQIKECLEAAGDDVAAIKIIPNYHDYSLEDSSVQDLADLLTSRGMPLCIQIRMLDERAHHPHMLVPPVPIAAIAELVVAHPKLKVLVCGAFNAELTELAPAQNVCVELSSIESGNTLPNALKVLPAERIMLGTHAPIYYPAPALAKVQGEDVLEESLNAIAGGNARRFLALESLAN